jgi:hypothetical protein
LHPSIELVDVDALVARYDGVFDVHLPAIEILERDETARRLRRRDEIARDVAAIETLVGREDRLFAVLTGRERLFLGFDELGQGREQLGLLEDLPGHGRRPRLRSFRIEVGQQHAARGLPTQQPLLVGLDVRALRLLHGIAGRHLQRGLEHLG